MDQSPANGSIDSAMPDIDPPWLSVLSQDIAKLIGRRHAVRRTNKVVKFAATGFSREDAPRAQLPLGRPQALLRHAPFGPTAGGKSGEVLDQSRAGGVGARLPYR